MPLNTFLSLCILLLLTSCHSQQPVNKPNAKHPVQIGEQVSTLGNSIWIVFQAANGDYWFGSDTSGVYRYDGKTLLQYSTKDGLSSNRIRGIQEDKQGNMYISNLEAIQKFDGQSFATLKAVASQSSSEHWKLQADDLWFSTLGKNGEGGPCRYDGERLYQLRFPKHFMEDAYFANAPNLSWSPYDVYSMYKDSQGAMWFGTSNFGLCRYDGTTWSWLYEDHLTNTPDGGSFGIRSILEGEKGKFWFCNTHYRFDISTDSTKEKDFVFVKYQKEKGMAGISSTDGRDYVYFMSAVKDKAGAIWLATYNQGVWRYDGKTAKHYPVMEQGKAITIFSIYKDKQEQIWLGTHENGAYRLKDDVFERFML